MERFPTPLMPEHWVTAAGEISVYLKRLQREVEASLKSPAKSTHLQAAIHEDWILAIVGLALLLFIQPWVVSRLERATLASQTRVRRWIFSILLNLMRLLLPGAGALALIQIVPVLDLTPFSARTLAQVLPFLALFLVVAHWLGHTLYAPSAPSSRLLPFDDTMARWGLRLSWGLGLVVAAEFALEAIERDYTFKPSTISVLSTPVIFIASILLWRLAALFRQKNTASATQPETAPLQTDSGFLTLISTLMRLSALVAPVLILLGFVNLSRHIAVPLILTMVELGVALFLYQLCIIVLNALNGRGAPAEPAEEETLSLLPIVVIFFLVLLLTPLLALTWGAHRTDIAEVWHLLTNGVKFGDIRLSLDVVLTLIVVLTVGTVLTRWIQRLLWVSVLPRTRLDSGARTALITGIGYIGLTLAALIAVSTAGLDLSSLAFVAGALSVGIGFGLQTIVSNFVSGIILLIERPIKEGDWIEVSGYTGFVRKIAVRSTRIETFDGHDVIVPNSDLIAGTVTNMTLSSKSGRLILPVGVAYGSDLEKTKSILIEAAKGHASLKNYPPPTVLFIGLGDSSLDFELRCFLHDVGELVTTKSDLLFTVYVELNRAGIEIPFPQRDLHLRDIDRLVSAIEGRGAVPEPIAAL
jgi:small-conductance mechanosensitive channel